MMKMKCGLLSNRNRDKMALVKFNVLTGKEALILENPKADIEHVKFSAKRNQPLFAYSFPDYPQIHVIEPDLKSHIDILKKEGFQGIKIIETDERETLWTVKLYDEKEENFYLYNTSTKEKSFLGSRRLDIPNQALASMNPISFESSDGLEINGYLTKPVGVQEEPLPMVLFVHGGPWARDYWEMDRMVQLFANRGYAVLQVNYRGSSGYGRHFMEAAINEFAQKMHRDLLDAVDWAVDNKVADPDNIAIVGGSYGGYAAMVGAALTPDVFNCAIAINGISDLGGFVKGLPKSADRPLYRKRGIDMWYEYVGKVDSEKEEKQMESRSPFYHANQVKKPILIIYGGKDTRVKPIHSRKMVAELKLYQKDVHELEFETEGHGIRWFSHSKKMYKKMETFLASHLGGRYEK